MAPEAEDVMEAPTETDVVAFPFSFDAMDPDVRAYLDAQIIQRQLAINDTPASMLKWLFRGTTLRGKEIHYGTAVRDIWPLVVQEAQQQARAAAAATATQPSGELP